MPSPFPGMDPYLEHPALWPDVHHGLIEELRNAMAPRLRPRYRVTVEERVYVTDVEGPFFIGRLRPVSRSSPPQDPKARFGRARDPLRQRRESGGRTYREDHAVYFLRR